MQFRNSLDVYRLSNSLTQFLIHRLRIRFAPNPCEGLYAAIANTLFDLDPSALPRHKAFGDRRPAFTGRRDARIRVETRRRLSRAFDATSPTNRLPASTSRRRQHRPGVVGYGASRTQAVRGDDDADGEHQMQMASRLRQGDAETTRMRGLASAPRKL